MTITEIHPRGATRLLWIGTIKPLLARYGEYRQRRRAAAELRSVDPRILKDMAIDRSEVDSIVYANSGDRRRAYIGGNANR
jgi:uncharacterized protein YjiS (DUF1127 family)